MTPRRFRFRWLRLITPINLIIGILVLAIAGYTLYRTKDLLAGPRLTVTAPVVSGAPLTDPLVTIGGQVARVDHLTLNGGPIFADSQGHFAEQLVLYAGYNIIEVEASDRFGRRLTRELELVYQPTNRPI